MQNLVACRRSSVIFSGGGQDRAFVSGSRLLSSLARLCRLRRPAVFWADRCASMPFFCRIQLFLSYFCPRSVFLRFLTESRFLSVILRFGAFFHRFFAIWTILVDYFITFPRFSVFCSFFVFLRFFRFSPFLHGPCRPRLAPVLSVALCVLLARLVASCCL